MRSDFLHLPNLFALGPPPGPKDLAPDSMQTKDEGQGDESETNFAVEQNDVTVGNAEGLQRSNVGPVVGNMLKSRLRTKLMTKPKANREMATVEIWVRPEMMPKFRFLQCHELQLNW